MGASLALAGVTALHAAAGRNDRAVRPPARGAHPRQAALLRHRDDARRRRDRPARREPRGPADQDRGQPAAPRQPRRRRRVRAGRDPRPLRSRSLADADQPRRDPPVVGVSRRDARRRSTAQQPLQGRRHPHPHRTVASPTLGVADPATLLARFPSAKWHQWEPASRDNARAGAKLAFGESVDAQYRLRQGRRRSCRSTPTSSAAARARCATRATSPRAGAPEQARSHEPALRRRDDADLDRRARRPPAAAAGPSEIARHRAAPASPRGARPVHGGAARRRRATARDVRSGSPPSPRICRRTAAAALVVAGDGQPPAVHALAHAINQALGNVGRPSSTPGPAEAEPVDQLESLRELVADMNAGKVELLLILGGNPVYTAPADLTFADALEQGAAARAPEPVRRRDVGAVPLAHSRGALPRSLERRARVRRHGVDRPAADRAALRRPVGARAARGAQRPAGALGATRSSATTGRAVEATATTSSTSGGDGCTTASIAEHRASRANIASTLARLRRQPRRRPGDAAGGLEIVFRPIRRSSTAASPTTAGCRSCRSRSPG